MSVLASVLDKAKALAENLANDVEKSKLVADAEALVKELEAEVEKDVAAVEKDVAGTSQPTPGETPEGSTVAPQPSDPATDNVNMGGTPAVEAPAAPEAPAQPDTSGVQTSSDLHG